METIVSILPQTETQARELTRIKDTPDQLAAWKRVLKRVDSNPALITAKIVREEVEKVIAPKPPRTGQGSASSPPPPPVSVTPPATERPAKQIPAKEVETEEPAVPAAPPKARPSPTLDGWGIPIQEHAAEAFAAVPRFAELVKAIQNAQRLFNEVTTAPGGEFLRLPSASGAGCRLF